MKVWELISLLQVEPQDHEVVIKVPDGPAYQGQPCYCSFEVTEVTSYEPDNGEVGIYFEEPTQ